MQIVKSLDELKLFQKHRDFLSKFFTNVSKAQHLDRIDQMILFGSCARGEAVANSDIDILILDEKAEHDDDLLFELYDCALINTSGDAQNYVGSDILTMSTDKFEKYGDEPGMVQRAVKRDGVILDGSLYK